MWQLVKTVWTAEVMGIMGHECVTNLLFLTRLEYILVHLNKNCIVDAIFISMKGCFAVDRPLSCTDLYGTRSGNLLTADQ